MKSLIGRPKTDMAGDSLVTGFGVLRYCNIATLKASVSSSPVGDVLEVMSRFAVLPHSSTLQLVRGKATDDRR